MSNGEFKKPVKNRQFIKSSEELAATHEQLEQDFKVEAAHAEDSYSSLSDNQLSDAEFLKRLRDTSNSNLLPDVPKIDGFHFCWIPQTSNNHFDTVSFRQNLGYSIVKPEEIPNYTISSNRSGEIEGCISYSEMILMKIPSRLYNLLMKDSHHNQPNEQERVIKQTITNMEDKHGENITRDLHEMTGINKLARKVAEPTFTN